MAARTETGARGIRIEFGRRWLAAEDVARMDVGDVLELDSHSQDLVDVYVDGRLYARGEPVVVDGHLGVRVQALLAGRARETRETTRTP